MFSDKLFPSHDPDRGRFRSFAILCMERHLFSIIKASTQQKRLALNQSLSLNEDRSEGDNLSLNTLVTKDEKTAVDKLQKEEAIEVAKSKLLAKLSKLEKEVFNLYIKQNSYAEIVEGLREIFPGKKLSRKAVDNSLLRVRSKARELLFEEEFFL